MPSPSIEATDLDAIFEEELAHFLETRWEAFADILAGNGDQAASRERLRDLVRRRAEREEERVRIEDLYLKRHIEHERFGALDERVKEDILEIAVAMREVERTLEKQGKRKRVEPSPTGELPEQEGRRSPYRLGEPQSAFGLRRDILWELGSLHQGGEKNLKIGRKGREEDCDNVDKSVTHILPAPRKSSCLPYDE